MLKRHLLKFWDHVGNETRSSDAPLSVSFLSMPHLFDLTCEIVRDVLFSALMLFAGLPIWFSSLIFRMPSPSLWRLRLVFNLDLVIFSRAIRQAIVIELTVPLEDHVFDAHERKNPAICHFCLCASVTDGMQLIFQLKSEAGFLLLSRFPQCLRQLGFLPTGQKVRNEASNVSFRCRYLIYLRRNIRVWQGSSGD